MNTAHSIPRYDAPEGKRADGPGRGYRLGEGGGGRRSPGELLISSLLDDDEEEDEEEKALFAAAARRGMHLRMLIQTKKRLLVQARARGDTQTVLNLQRELVRSLVAWMIVRACVRAYVRAVGRLWCRICAVVDKGLSSNCAVVMHAHRCTHVFVLMACCCRSLLFPLCFVDHRPGRTAGNVAAQRQRAAQSSPTVCCCRCPGSSPGATAPSLKQNAKTQRQGQAPHA